MDFDQCGDFDSFIKDLLGRSRRRTSTHQTALGGFDDFGNGFRSQAPAPDTEAAIAFSTSGEIHDI